MSTMWMMIKNTCTLVRRRKMTGQGMFTGITMYSFLMDDCSVLTTMSVATVVILLMSSMMERLIILVMVEGDIMEGVAII